MSRIHGLNRRADSLEGAEVGMEGKEVGRFGDDCGRKLEEDQGRQHFETDDMCKTQEELSSGQEIQNNDTEIVLLMSKFKSLDDKKAALETEVEMLRKRNMELEERIASSEKDDKIGGFKREAVAEMSGKSVMNGEIIVIDDESNINQFIDNDVLECERKAAKKEVAFWKHKCSELESRLLLLLRKSLDFSDKEVSSVKSIETNKVSLRDNLVSKGASVALQNVNDDAFKEAGTPVKTPHSLVNVKNEFEAISIDAGINYCKKARKKLSFVDDGMSNKKVAPVTPAVKWPKSNHVIDLIDSDEEQDLPSLGDQAHKVLDVSTPLASARAIGGGDKLKAFNIMVEDDDEEDMSSIPFLATPKRKRALRLVSSDSEAEDVDDDNIPISQLLRKKFQPAYQNPLDMKYTGPPPDLEFAGNEGSKTCQRRRLMRMTVLEDKSGTQLQSKMLATVNVDVNDQVEMEGDQSANDMKYGHSGTNYDGNINSSTRRSQRLLKMRMLKERNRTHKTEFQSRIHPSLVNIHNDDRDDEMEEDWSDSDSDNLKDFIINDDVEDDASGVANSDIVLDGKEVSYGQEDSSDSEIDLDEILHKIKRSKNHEPMKWEMVGDMLSAFGKDLELCMRAVCALCRRQTHDEQEQEGTFEVNQQGFSKFDAARGTKLAKFLTDGDLEGDLRRGEEELRKYDPDALELCRTLAIRYSKQLFDIYQRGEDAFFCPP